MPARGYDRAMVVFSCHWLLLFLACFSLFRSIINSNQWNQIGLCSQYLIFSFSGCVTRISSSHQSCQSASKDDGTTIPREISVWHLAFEQNLLINSTDKAWRLYVLKTTKSFTKTASVAYNAPCPRPKRSMATRRTMQPAKLAFSWREPTWTGFCNSNPNLVVVAYEMRHRHIVEPGACRQLHAKQQRQSNNHRHCHNIAWRVNSMLASMNSLKPTQKRCDKIMMIRMILRLVRSLFPPKGQQRNDLINRCSKSSMSMMSHLL